jgi:hypothetical protein
MVGEDWDTVQACSCTPRAVSQSRAPPACKHAASHSNWDHSPQARQSQESRNWSRASRAYNLSWATSAAWLPCSTIRP